MQIQALVRLVKENFDEIVETLAVDCGKPTLEAEVRTLPGLVCCTQPELSNKSI
jgi:hypothetical protein